MDAVSRQPRKVSYSCDTKNKRVRKIKDISSPIFKPPLNMYIDLLFQLGLAISGDRDGAADGTH